MPATYLRARKALLADIGVEWERIDIPSSHAYADLVAEGILEEREGDVCGRGYRREVRRRPTP